MTQSLVRPRPDVPLSQHGKGDLVLRYEDVSQDGRLACRAMTHGLGSALWRDALQTHPAVPQLTNDGVVPILSRITAHSQGGPIGVQLPVRCEGVFAFVKTTDARGKVRYRVDMWVDLEGKQGRTHGPIPTDADPTLRLGSVVAEHVLTRPFGPPDQRQVTELPASIEPSGSRAWEAPESLLELPEGASWIEAEASLDASTTVFGLGHTDSNQHVNSLVYPPMIEEAALRRADALGRPDVKFAHWFDLAFRKPCFAGDRARVSLRAYQRGDAFGVVGAVVEAGDPTAIRSVGRLELIA